MIFPKDKSVITETQAMKSSSFHSRPSNYLFIATISEPIKVKFQVRRSKQSASHSCALPNPVHPRGAGEYERNGRGCDDLIGPWVPLAVYLKRYGTPPQLSSPSSQFPIIMYFSIFFKEKQDESVTVCNGAVRFLS